MSDARLERSVVEVPDSVFRFAIGRLTNEAFLTLDPAGLITSWNAGAERLFGFARTNALGVHVSAIFRGNEPGSGVGVEDLELVQRQGAVSGDRWLRHQDGTGRDCHTTLLALDGNAGLIGYALLAYQVSRTGVDDTHGGSDTPEATLEDTARQLSESRALLTAEIADRRRAEEGRIELLRRLIVAQEEERRRIARDLHDDLGQRLTALRLTLEASAKEPRDQLGGNDSAIEMLVRIDQALDFLAWELRPAALDELGLTRVLDTYVHEWSRHAGVRATFHSGFHGTERLAAEVEASVYRIAQEALNNVAKHAQARSVNVLLELREEFIVLVVEDDGLGFRPLHESETTIGLTGMRERAAAVGGSLEIEPTPGGGTTVLSRIPVVAPLQVERRREASAAGARRPSPAVDGAIMVPADTTGSVVAALRARLQELQRAVAARDDFIATVAHELRNPVAPLTFQIRLAIEKTEHIATAGQSPSAEWVQSQLRRVEQRLHRLLETLDRLLDVSRLSTGRIDLQREPTNLGATVREVVGTLDAELAVARCTLTLIERAEAIGLWDRLRLEQICRNLLSNAIRFGAGRPIEVVVDADSDFATLEVRDHGVGVAPDQQARIFERFERGVEQRSGGFGVGLWVVRNICAAMGGTVTVESGPGEGARFTVMLPQRKERESINVRSEST